MKRKQTTSEIVIATTGKKPIECKCADCKSQCSVSGLSIPEEIEAMINEGFADSLIDYKINMPEGNATTVIKIKRNGEHCSQFNVDTGLCNIHNTYFKPLECRLSHHSYGVPRRKKDSISYVILKLWAISDYVRLSQMIIVSKFLSLTNPILFRRITNKEISKVRCKHCEETIDAANISALHRHVFNDCSHQKNHILHNGVPDKPDFEPLIIL